MVKSSRIERGDWLTLQVKVTDAWDDGRVTVEHMTGQKVTMGCDSAEIIEIRKPTGRKSGRARENSIGPQ
jgi:hypothetical protein